MFEVDEFSALEEELAKSGYFPTVPSPQCEDDREIAEKGACPKCGKKMAFQPYTAFSPKPHYRAFAVCRDCDHASEF